jgi:hypothetical protein
MDSLLSQCAESEPIWWIDKSDTNPPRGGWGVVAHSLEAEGHRYEEASATAGVAGGACRAG